MGNKYSGFASMTKEERRKTASSGGKTAHKLGRAHQYTSEEASAAAKKGWEKRKKSAQSIAGE